jgi:hypothetical protein
MSLKIRGLVLKYYPLIVFMVSVFLSYFCISYRKKDWITGGLILQVIVLPTLFLEALMIIGFYRQDKFWAKRIFFLIELMAAICLLVFTFVYIFKYN